jgi:hypothetical protein
MIWLFPEWLSDKSILWFSFFGWALVNFLYGHLICPRIEAEVQKRRESFDDACCRYSAAAGMSFNEKARAAYHDLHHFSGHATSEENNDFWATEELSVIRLVKNKFALRRYDLD